jgi:hypothetical protein
VLKRGNKEMSKTGISTRPSKKNTSMPQRAREGHANPRTKHQRTSLSFSIDFGNYIYPFTNINL